MSERDERWEALVQQAFKEGIDRGFHQDEHEHVIYIDKEWKDSTARKMAKAIAKEAK